MYTLNYYGEVISAFESKDEKGSWVTSWDNKGNDTIGMEGKGLGRVDGARKNLGFKYFNGSITMFNVF